MLLEILRILATAVHFTDCNWTSKTMQYISSHGSNISHIFYIQLSLLFQKQQTRTVLQYGINNIYGKNPWKFFAKFFFSLVG